MGSPISLSGFNNIDFNLILNAIMEQERVPLAALEATRTNLEGQDFEYGILATMLSDVELAADKLASSNSFGARSVAISDDTAVGASVGSTTPLGTYDVIVQQLARAQVTASTSTYADSDSTVVATFGTLTIGGVDVTINDPVTLDELVAAINGTANIPVTASALQSGPNSYQLLLTGNETGAANAFSITNLLVGGAGVTFLGNAVEATDAAATVNNISITGETNTITGAIPGATITLLKQDPATTVSLTVSRDDQSFKTDVDAFVSAYNNLIGYADAQFASAAEGTATSIGRDGLLRGLRTALRSTVSQAYNVGGTYSYLSEVGIGSNIAGELTVDATLLDDALATNFDDLRSLFVGAGGIDGVFKTLDAAITAYTESGGLIPGVQTRLDDRIASIDDRILRLEEQLIIRRASLESEFIAADIAISQLNSQLSSLNGLANQFRSF